MRQYTIAIVLAGWLTLIGCDYHPGRNISPISVQVIEGHLTASIDSSLKPGRWLGRQCRQRFEHDFAVREVALLLAFDAVPDLEYVALACLEDAVLDDTLALALLRLGTPEALAVLVVSDWDTTSASSAVPAVPGRELARALELLNGTSLSFVSNDAIGWLVGRAAPAPAIRLGLEMAILSDVGRDEYPLPAWSRLKGRSPYLTMELAHAFASSRYEMHGEEALNEMLTDPSATDTERGLIWGALLSIEPDEVRARLLASLRRELSPVVWRNALASFLIHSEGGSIRAQSLIELIELSENRSDYARRLERLALMHSRNGRD